MTKRVGLFTITVMVGLAGFVGAAARAGDGWAPCLKQADCREDVVDGAGCAKGDVGRKSTCTEICTEKSLCRGKSCSGPKNIPYVSRKTISVDTYQCKESGQGYGWAKIDNSTHQYTWACKHKKQECSGCRGNKYTVNMAEIESSDAAKPRLASLPPSSREAFSREVEEASDANQTAVKRAWAASAQTACVTDEKGGSPEVAK